MVSIYPKMSLLSARQWSGISLGLFALVVAIIVRMADIGAPAPQPDERLWVVRSHKLLINMAEKPHRATTHLGHPGIPPAIVMAFGQYLGERYNRFFGFEPGDKGYVSKLVSARRAIALISSLVVVVVFAGTMLFFGKGPAFIAAMLVALDPRSVGYARMAHLDAVLALLATLTVVLYLLSLRYQSLILKLIAGIGWGLCIATKPTAGVLIVIFLIFRSLCRLFNQRKEKSPLPLFSWSDVAAFCMGHLVLAALYTRLWVHRSDYRQRLHIRTPVAKFFWQNGNFLNENWWIVTFSLILGLLAALYLFKRRKQPLALLYFHSLSATVFGAFFVALLALFPQVFENFARFWTWAIGLSGERHIAYGQVSEPLPFGYLTFLVTELPEHLLFGIALAVLALGYSMFSGSIDKDESTPDKRFYIFAFLFTAILWIIPLSFADKQTWRYALPVLPSLAIASAWGLNLFFKKCLGLLKFLSPLWQTRLYVSLISVLFLYQVHIATSWNPDYLVYFNKISKGISGALSRQQGFPFIGQREAVAFLVEEAKTLNEPIYISVAGDGKTFDYTRALDFPHFKNQLNFARFSPAVADYFVYFASHKNLIDKRLWGGTLSKQAVFTFSYKGLDLLKVFKVPVGSFTEKETVLINHVHRKTGVIEYDPEEHRPFVTVSPANDQAGYILFHEGFRVTEGNYKINVRLKTVSVKNSAKVALRLDLSYSCSKLVNSSELNNQFTDFELTCKFKQNERAVPRIYWFGLVPLSVSDLTFVRSH